jgi:heat shock protein HslJ
MPGDGELAAMVFFIDEQQLEATHSCTRLRHRYQFDGDRLTAEIVGEPAINCGAFPSRPGAAMLIGLLTDGAEVDLVGDELTLSGPEASLTLIDQETADPDRPLIGTLWEGSVILFGSGASSYSSLASVTLVFSEDAVDVDTGCVTATVAVEVEDQMISSDPLPGADRVCGESAVAIDQAVREIMAAPFAWNVRADQLTVSRVGIDPATAAVDVVVGLQLGDRPAGSCPDVSPFFTTPTPQSVPSPDEVPVDLDADEVDADARQPMCAGTSDSDGDDGDEIVEPGEVVGVPSA